MSRATAHSTTDATSIPAPMLALHTRWQIGILTALFLAVHYDILFRIARFAMTDGDWSHAFLVPVFSLYLIFQKRDALAQIPFRTCWPGLPLMALGLAGYLIALAAGSDMLKGYAVIVELLGLALLLAGPAAMRFLWFPIVYLLFAVKIAEPLWESIAHQLQLLAASGAVALLMIVGVEAHVTQITIELFENSQLVGSLNVAEACSGMRMLMTFLALGTAMAYLWNRPTWAKVLMVLLCVPIAVLVNVGRVTVLSLLYLIDPKYSQGDFHIFMGMLMLIPALALFVGMGYLLNMLIDPVASSSDEPGPAAPPSASPSSPSASS
jgi:exosortase